MFFYYILIKINGIFDMGTRIGYVIKTLTFHSCFHNCLLSEAAQPAEPKFLTLTLLMGMLLLKQLNCKCLILG